MKIAEPQVPPHSPEAEVAILGACLYSPGAADRACEALSAEDFYTQKARTVFEAIQGLRKEGRDVDLVTVTSRLRDAGKLALCGGSAMDWIDDWSFTSEYLDEHIRIARDKSTLRQLLTFSRDYAGRAMGEVDDVALFVAHMAERVGEMANTRSPKDPRSISDLMPSTMADMRRAHNGEAPGIPIGLAELQRMIGGWKAPDMVVIGARPSMGKTAFALACANDAAEVGKRTLMFSMEMSASQISQRLLSMRTKLSGSQVSSGWMSSADFQRTQDEAQALADSRFPLWIDDEAALTPERLTLKARSLHRKAPLGLIVVDYLQLMRSSARGDNREREVAQASGAMKGLAKELDVPVLVLSQLNRKLDDRLDKTPQLSDLRDSGTIEADADVIVFIHRPAVYDKNHMPANEAIFTVAKNRSGAVGAMSVAFHAQTTTFQDVSGQPVQGYPSRCTEDDS